MRRSAAMVIVSMTGAAGLVACVGVVGGDAGIDGGFPDTAVVPVSPMYIVDESGDLGLLLSVRALPAPAEGVELEEFEVTAYDDATGEQRWIDREPLPASLGSVVTVGQIDPRRGMVEMEIRGVLGGSVRLDYQPRSESLVARTDAELTPLFEELDFGAFRVGRHDFRTREEDERVYHDGLVGQFSYGPGFMYPLIGARTIVTDLRRGPGASLMLDALRYGPLEARERDGVTEFVERRLDGVLDVYLVEVATGAVVGVGERRPPEGVSPLYVGPRIEQNGVVDRAGRVYFRDTAEVSSEPILRAGIDASVDEVTLAWGEHEECLGTRIFAVGPEGHILTRERPDDRFPNGPADGVVCLFAPNGALVLALPAEAGRAWVGFSDPVQWFGP